MRRIADVVFTLCAVVSMALGALASWGFKWTRTRHAAPLLLVVVVALSCHKHVEERHDATLQVHAVDDASADKHAAAAAVLHETAQAGPVDVDDVARTFAPLPDGGTYLVEEHARHEHREPVAHDTWLSASFGGDEHTVQHRQLDVDAGVHDATVGDLKPALPEVPVSCVGAGWLWAVAIGAGALLTWRTWRRTLPP